MEVPPTDSPDPAEAVIAFVRSRHEGVLLIEEDVHRVRLIIDGWRGRPVFPAPAGVVEGSDAVLCIPEDSDDAVQLLGDTHVVPAGSEPSDRWTAYHGDSRTTRWLALSVGSAKTSGDVLDGPQVDLRNALHACESALCRKANADPEALKAMVVRRAGVTLSSPRTVGVDERGFDVRARFGIVRIEFPSRAADEADAARMIEGMIRGGA